MVMIKATTLAVLLGSAALSSAAVIPNVNKPEARGDSINKREWKGKLGARGPWRQENDDFLINLDLTGDGAHHNGHGSLIDLNTRSEKHDILRRELKEYMQRTEPIISIGHDSHELPADPLVDINVALGLAERDDRLLELAARLISGSSEAAHRFSARDDVDLAGLESAAKDAGVTDEQIVAAKNAVDNLSPEQKAEVENAVKHAMFMVSRPGEKRKVPGPAFLFRKSNEDAVAAIKQGGNVKVVGGEEPKDAGVFASGDKHGAPLVAQPGKRSVAEEMGGAPGYIDITSPVFNSTATRLASLVLSTSNGTNENSTFVLNASSSVRTQVFMVPLNSTTTGEPESKVGDMIKVNLKVPVFVAESAAVEPFCATFDPSPNAPEPMTVEPCDEPEDERSQIFLFDPETGAVKPNWTPSESNQQLLASVPDSVSSDLPLPSASQSSAVSSVAASASVSISARTSSAAPTASASASVVEMLDAASATSDAPLALPTEAMVDPIEPAEPSDWESEPLPTSTEDWATAAGLPTESPMPSASNPSSALPTELSAVPSAIPTPALFSIAPEELVTAFAASSAAIPSASASAVPSSPHSSGNNVTLIFTPANASVQSSDSDEEATPAKSKSKREYEERDDESEDCEDVSAEIFAFAAPASVPTPHASHSSAPATAASASAKPKAKSPKLPEDASNSASEAGNKVHIVQGEVKVDNIQSLAGRMLVKNWKREQKVMMAPSAATAPYQWTWTSVEDAEKEPEETVKVFAALAARK